ncbi:hypothetical protein L2E82_17059 [Cichorium intybus]|uniref:Uncharacterized protein n=1 Tax=Cichorium intybus TaxID=13427 RepID=A0ACB9F7W6_CICIN|nr:hypothetical protein L2E82_17059 [Cichorium intybus]
MTVEAQKAELLNGHSLVAYEKNGQICCATCSLIVHAFGNMSTNIGLISLETAARQAEEKGHALLDVGFRLNTVVCLHESVVDQLWYFTLNHTGHIKFKVRDAGQDIQETMDILVENGLDPGSEEYGFIRYNILYGGNFMRCEEWCRLPVITPCRHLLCLEYVALNNEKCTFPGCENLYEMENPETFVPKDLIELQPSYKHLSFSVLNARNSNEANKITYNCHNENHDGKDVNALFLPFDKSMASVRSTNGSVEKVLIFYQFLEHIHVIEQQLMIAGIKFVGMYSPMQPKYSKGKPGNEELDAIVVSCYPIYNRTMIVKTSYAISTT